MTEIVGSLFTCIELSCNVKRITYHNNILKSYVVANANEHWVLVHTYIRTCSLSPLRTHLYCVGKGVACTCISASFRRIPVLSLMH